MRGVDLMRLDDQVCFALYSAHRAVTALYRPLLEPLGLTYPQYLVMLALWEADEATERVRVSWLKERLRLDTGTLTPLLKRMQQNELLQRTRDRDDERVVMVSLTPAGRALRDRAVDVPGQMMCRSGLSADQVTQLRDSLRTLLANLED